MVEQKYSFYNFFFKKNNFFKKNKFALYNRFYFNIFNVYIKDKKYYFIYNTNYSYTQYNYVYMYKLLKNLSINKLSIFNIVKL